MAGSKWCFNCGHNVMYITLSHTSHDAVKGGFVRSIDVSQINVTPYINLSFCMNFLKFSNKIGRAWCKHHLACDCAHLCQILGHLNNARLINGPRVANWG